MKKSALALALTMAIGLFGCSENGTGSKATAQSEPLSAAYADDVKGATAGPRICRPNPENATALGIEVGYANLAGAKQALKGKIDISESELDPDTIMLGGEGDAGVPGVQSIALTVNKQTDVVEVIVLTMDKDPVAVAKNLSQKYSTRENHIDSFMNNGMAKYEKGDTQIVLNAPHMSFSMVLTYGTKSFWKQLTDSLEQSENQAKTRLRDGL